MKKSMSNFPPRRGFALVVTLSLMILLTVIAVGLLSLASVSLRTSSRSTAQQLAQANARMALMQAIGELQKFAGPDQRVTTPSDVNDDSVEKHWTGVWSTKGKDTLPAWLVSGNDSRNVTDLDTLSSYPASYKLPTENLVDGKDAYSIYRSKTTGNADLVKVPIVDVIKGGKKEGRYAWWVSDEGAKARVDVKRPEGTPASNGERVARAGISSEPNLRTVDLKLGPLSDPASSVYTMKDRLPSYGSLDLTINDNTIADQYAHDLTNGGYGLPVNVVDGGMKTDLSVLFDSSQETNTSLQGQYFGATATKTSDLGATYFDFSSVSSNKNFYFIPELSGNGAKPTGPNWGTLYDYGRMWLNAKSNTTPLITMHPNIQSDIVTNKWAPYSNASIGGAWGTDVQHTTSALAPVISWLQVGFRLTADPVLVNIPNSNPPTKGYQLQLQVKPVIGIWNPYNTKMSAKVYTLVWTLNPYIQIASNTAPNIPGYPVKWIRSEIFLRDAWKDPIHAEAAFKMQTPNVDFEPGEMRLFSVTGKANIEEFNKMTPSWNEDGAFVINLAHSYGQDIKSGANLVKGEPFVIPPGSKAWFGDAYLDDLMSTAGRAYNPSKVVDGKSATSLWFHAGSTNSIQRIADLWPVAPRSVTTPIYDLPERIVSLYNRTGGQQLGDIPVELLVKTPSHLGTWRFFSRTSSQAPAAAGDYGSQRIRNWVDANPRFGAASPVWDGSLIDDKKGEGLPFISPFMGGTITGSKPSGYAQGPEGRGKVAEGQDESGAAPESDISGRYRGFGGYATDSVDGQSHIPLFDVPRAPLVSLGQLQHAQLARYSYEPTFPFGNSYASFHIPLNKTVVPNFGGISGFNMADLSYLLNRTLWDRYFFSTIGVDYKSASGTGNIDSLFPIKDLASGKLKLTNPRYTYLSRDTATPISKILARSDKLGAQAISSNIAVQGAFNVNSTSVPAWKAILSSMENFEFPVLSENGASVSWENKGGIRFPRFGHVMQKSGWNGSVDAGGPEFWSGYRTLSDSELDQLAKEIVLEIRARSKTHGPFRSFAEFVNRDTGASDVKHRQKGALQAAIDRVINNKAVGLVGEAAETPKGTAFQSDVLDKESQAAGSAGYLMQSDVLQALAPVLEVRSDYFRVRAMGQATDAAGNITATAVCEAYVQRVPDYVNPQDEQHLAFADLKSDSNKKFGRVFDIVSFKWLNPNEI